MELEPGAVWGILAGVAVCAVLLAVWRPRAVAAATVPEQEPADDSEWQVASSVIEFNYALTRVCDDVDAPATEERPCDVRSAIDLAAKLVRARQLSVKDAEVLERNQPALTVVDGRLVARAEEERRKAYLRAHGPAGWGNDGELSGDSARS